MALVWFTSGVDQTYDRRDKLRENTQTYLTSDPKKARPDQAPNSNSEVSTNKMTRTQIVVSGETEGEAWIEMQRREEYYSESDEFKVNLID